MSESYFFSERLLQITHFCKYKKEAAIKALLLMKLNNQDKNLRRGGVLDLILLKGIRD